MGSEERVWVCLVCGYVHRGPEPPEMCPVCGASRQEFEAGAEPAQAAPKQQAGTWRCLICGYTHEGSEPPELCPVCGASKDEFEPVQETVPADAGAPSAARVVVVGGGIAGVAAIETLRETSPQAEIVLISREQELPYYRLNLTRYLAGEITDADLPLHSEDWYAEQRVTLLRGAEVTAILPEDHAVEIGEERREPFDKLILACGAHPFVPPIPGASLAGVHTLRTAEDARTLLRAAQQGTRCVCIGGGILGLETAGALAKHGVKVTLIETFEWLLPRQLNRDAAMLLHRFVAERGIDLRYQAMTSAIVGDEHARGVELANGDVLDADFVVVTTGVRPNTALARKAGLEVNQGVVVDAHLTTSHRDILAAGDVAEHRGTLYGLWEPARYQGTIAAMNALGVPTEFGGLPRANTLKVLGVDMFSVGVVAPQDGSYVIVSEQTERTYCQFLFRDNALAGAILVGDTQLAAAALKAIKTRRDCSAILAKRPSAREVWRGIE